MRRLPPIIVRGLLLAAITSLAGVNGASAATSTVTLTLNEAYTRARSRAPELLAAKERVIQAELDVRRAWALLKPSWSASFTYTHTEPEPPRFEIPALPDFRSLSNNPACQAEDRTADQLLECADLVLDELTRAGDLGPTVFDFARQDTALFRTQITWNVLNGRALPLLANAKDTVTLEAERFKQQERALLLAVARAYFAGAAAQDAVTVSERGVERARARLALAEQKATAGEQAPAALRLEQIASRQAEIELERSRSTLRQSLLAVALVLGDELPPARLTAPESLAPPAETEGALIERALSTREDVLAAQLALIVAERTKQDAWWKFAPTVSLFGGYRWSNVDGISGQNDEWSFGVTASALLYDGGLRYADLAQADSNIRLAGLTLERIRRAASQDVRRARLRLESSALGVDRATQLLRLAEERAALTRTQYEAGAAREIELQESADAVRDAEIAVIAAKLERDLAILELQHAAGLFAP